MASLRALAAKITTIADALEEFKTSQLDHDGNEQRSWLRTLPHELGQKRLDLLDTLQEMKNMVQTVDSSFEELLYCHADVASMKLLYRLKLPQLVPEHGCAPYGAVSRACQLNEAALRRIFRYAMTNHLFVEPKPGHVGHSEMSLMLSKNPDAFDALGMVFEELEPASQQLPTALKQHPQASEPTKSGYNVAHSTGLPLFLFLELHPKRARRFGAAMRYFTQGDMTDIQNLVEAFPWHDYDRENVKLVDVGGGQGAVALQLAAATKHMRFVVQDFEQVVAAGREAVSEEFCRRVEFMAHNFFTEQPVKGADIYFFRWIMHNWSDEYAIRILRALVPALRQGAKVLLYEHVLEDVADNKPSGKGGRYMDMVMLASCNGCTRTENGWLQLFREADRRYTSLSFRKVLGKALSLIEVTWDAQAPLSKDPWK